MSVSDSVTDSSVTVVVGSVPIAWCTLDIDDCWQAARQYANETIVPDPVRFPSGMAELASDVHALGMKFGV